MTTQNVFAVKTQAELNTLIHRPQDHDCLGDCEWCSKFHKTQKLTKAVAKNKIVITLTENKDALAPNWRYRVWCEECTDGENNGFYDCCDWAARHAKHNHGAKK